MSPLAISLRFLQTQPDERLVALARDGHERAFEALVRRYRGPLLAYCRRVAPRDTSPEDILQQGLLQAWRALSGGAEVRDARAWLYRIVHNVAITALRASGELPDGMIAGAGAPGVEQIVEQRMAARDALAGLAALPDLQRQVMVSTALDGRSHEEIAAALGLSSGSVRGLIYRARSTLRAAAAAVIPAPVIDWALGDAGTTTAGLAGAGAGSAGLGALILKGSAILAVGAVAGTAAIVAGHRSHHARRSQASPVAARAGDETAAGRADTTTTDDGARAASIFAAGAVEPGLRGEGRDGSGDRRSHGGSGRDHSGDGGGPGPSGSDGGGATRGGSGGPRDGSSGGDTATTATSGSDGGGGGTTTVTSGRDGGGDPGTTTTTSGRDGGGGSGGGSDGGTFSGSFGGGTSGSSDGGGSGGGSDGGSSTTTTTTTTTDGGH